MKKIGLLGGTSWTSTFQYYHLLNTSYNAHKGAYHSAPIMLYSIDYNKIKQNYAEKNGWDIIPSLLKKELDILTTMPINGFMICNNTLHKAYDILKQQDQIDYKIPVFHALELTAQQAKTQNYKSVLLLGTKYTMTEIFFKEYFNKQNINVVIPNATEIDQIQEMQTRISLNKHNDDDSIFFENILKKYQNQTDSAVLGCTELPLVIRNPADFCLLNPIHLQCKKAIEFMVK